MSCKISKAASDIALPFVSSIGLTSVISKQLSFPLLAIKFSIFFTSSTVKPFSTLVPVPLEILGSRLSTSKET